MRKAHQHKYLLAMRKLIRKAYSEKGARHPNKVSPGEELRVSIARYRKTLKEMPQDIELWLALYDEAIAFWFAVWAAYRLQIGGPSDKRLVCLMALAGRVFQDMVCVRELIVGGFFVQSNVVTRSLIEAIDVMHLLNSKSELATEFEQIKENSVSSKFWHKYCSRDKISKIVKERWIWFFDGDEEPAHSFHALRDGYLDLMGMSAHPSFNASFVTFMDSTKGDSDSIAENAMGSISHMSKFTMHLILNRVFEYGFLWSGPEMSIYKSDVVSKPEPFLRENISKGLSVLLSIVQTTSEGSRGDPLFPEFETYWRRESSDEKA